MKLNKKQKQKQKQKKIKIKNSPRRVCAKTENSFRSLQAVRETS